MRNRLKVVGGVIGAFGGQLATVVLFTAVGQPCPCQTFGCRPPDCVGGMTLPLFSVTWGALLSAVAAGIGIVVGIALEDGPS